MQFNLAYTYSRSKDTSSADPGSTAGGGKPDVPNTGFVVQGDQRDLDANYALSDFDRPHRFSGSFVWELPGQGSLSGFRVSGFVQMQSGLPYSIFSAEPELGNGRQYTDLVRGSGGLYRLGFGRPSLCGSLDELRQAGDDPTEAAFDKSVLCSPTTAAGGYPGNQGFGNLGRNVLRGFWQRRVDLSLAKSFAFGLAQRRSALGRVQCVQHRELRAAQQRDRWIDDRLRQDHRFGRRAACHAARGANSLLERPPRLSGGQSAAAAAKPPRLFYVQPVRAVQPRRSGYMKVT